MITLEDLQAAYYRGYHDGTADERTRWQKTDEETLDEERWFNENYVH